jgi:hypothetical protein
MSALGQTRKIRACPPDVRSTPLSGRMPSETRSLPWARNGLGRQGVRSYKWSVTTTQNGLAIGAGPHGNDTFDGNFGHRDVSPALLPE